MGVNCLGMVQNRANGGQRVKVPSGTIKCSEFMDYQKKYILSGKSVLRGGSYACVYLPYEDFSWISGTLRCVPSMSGLPYQLPFHSLCKFICLSSGPAIALQRRIPLPE
jgi:hypothetical protein